MIVTLYKLQGDIEQCSQVDPPKRQIRTNITLPTNGLKVPADARVTRHNVLRMLVG